MEKVLNLRGLGTGGRQNELIELALTHRFDSVEIDMNDLLGRNERMGRKFALQFLQSAKTKVGTFKLPVSFGAEDAAYAAQIEKLATIAELATELQCARCYVEIESGSDQYNFQENFERQRLRLHEVGQRLQESGIRLGLALQHGAPQQTRTYPFIRSADELLTLVRMVGQKQIGVVVDVWNWLVCGGNWAQLENLNTAWITEVRLADIPADIQPAAAKPQQIELPGNRPDSISLKFLVHLCQSDYDQAVSIGAHPVMFVDQHRDQVVHEMSRRLSTLIGIANGTQSAEELFGVETDELAAAQ